MSRHRQTGVWSRVAGHLLRVASGLIVITVLQAQETKDKWQRVYTGEDSIIEINVSHYTFEPNRLMRIEIRTTLTTPEKISSTSETRYKTRLEKIDFKLNERRYRVSETTIIDPTGKTLSSYQLPVNDEWRVIKPGGIMERLFSAARVLPPFGLWRVSSYRFADAGPGAAKTSELERLVGTPVRLNSDQAAVGTKVCSFPDYQSKRATRDELSKTLGVQLEVLGINAATVETITVKCSESAWSPPQSLIIKDGGDEVLMLWYGVFLVLKTERKWSDELPPVLKPVLKRRTPP